MDIITLKYIQNQGKFRKHGKKILSKDKKDEMKRQPVTSRGVVECYNTLI